MHTLKSAAVFTALASGTLSFFTSPVQAAVLTTGQAGHPANAPYGSLICAEVNGVNPVPGTAIQVWDCHAGPNQQFEFNSYTIYASGGQGCMDIGVAVLPPDAEG